MTYTEEQYNEVLRTTAAELQALRNSTDAQVAAANAATDAAKASLAAIEAAIDADDLDTAKSEVAKTKQTARQKERAELQAQRKQLDDRIAALT